MMSYHKRLVTLFALAGMLTSTSAFADDDEKPNASNWPLAVTERPLTLNQGMFEIAGDTLRVNLSSGAVGKPISFAPDVWYGLNRGVTLGITHDTGLCLSGGCGYSDTGVEARLHLLKFGKSEMAASFGAHIPRFSDPFVMGASVGLLSRLTFGSLALRVDPRIYIGVLGRDYRQELVEVPVQVQYLLNPNTTAYLVTGLTNGTLSGFGNNAKVPIGLGAVIAISSRFDVGGEFRFDNLAGPAPNKGSERSLTVRMALRI